MQRDGSDWSEEREVLSWTQPKCERCWIEANSTWESCDGHDLLIEVRMPVRISVVEVEQCAFCGAATISGIYVRHDPADVPYPAKER